MFIVHNNNRTLASVICFNLFLTNNHLMPQCGSSH